MANLSHIVYVLASLFNPIRFLQYHHHDHGDQHSTITSSSASTIEHNHNPKVALFVFGDSPFEAGNLQYLPNVTVEDDEAIAWPNGMTFFHHPTGRYSDGRIVPDFIAKFANLPMLPPYLQPGPHAFSDGSNFATGGAGVLTTTNLGTTVSLPMQVNYFRNVTKLLQQILGHLEAKIILSNAVYLISSGSGGCDYFTFYGTYPNATQPRQLEYVAMVIGDIYIYNLGGRKIAFQNVGSQGCMPFTRQIYVVVEGCVEGLQSLASLHNTALANVLIELESQLPGFKYSVFNYFDATVDRNLNSTTYGFTNGTDACCGLGPYRGNYCGGDYATKPYELCENPGDYVWFDGAHSSERANFQYAELIWSGTPNTTGPYNVQQLFQ